MTPTPVFKRSPRTPKKRPGRALGPSEPCKSWVSCRILVVPPDSWIFTLLKYHAVSGEGGNTLTRVIPTDLLVSFPFPPCSSLSRKGGTHPRASHQQVFLSISCFPPSPFIPLRIIGCAAPHSVSNKYTNKHTYIHIYIYIYVQPLAQQVFLAWRHTASHVATQLPVWG